ncbi:MAG: alpha/beta hydrolase [Myxococcales bacterium]|nr:alpha/beta hydrolase [Myxococcales bacterium]
MRSMFKNAEARVRMASWYDRFHARIPSPTASRVVQTRFGDTHVLVGGPDDAPPVVVLHGALASSAHALVELAPLLERFRLHAVDVIGQSVKSADARPRVDNDDYGHWLADVLDGLELSCARVVGISWGGFASIRLAAAHPARIEKLALLVPAGLVGSPAWDGWVRVGWPMTKYVLFPSEARLRAFMKNLLTTPDDREWVGFLGDAFRAYNLSMKVPALARPEDLSAFTAPTLVLAADRDASFPGAALLQRAREVFPNLAESELIPNCNHCPPTTDDFRAWLAQRIGAFLAT